MAEQAAQEQEWRLSSTDDPSFMSLTMGEGPSEFWFHIPTALADKGLTYLNKAQQEVRELREQLARANVMNREKMANDAAVVYLNNLEAENARLREALEEIVEAADLHRNEFGDECECGAADQAAARAVQALAPTAEKA